MTDELPVADFEITEAEAWIEMLLAARVNAAASAGCRWIICDTMEETPARPNPSFRNMCRAGFETAYLRTNYLYDPGRGP